MADTERRIRDRAKARLRPAKLFDQKGGFVADCAIVDRSADGLRLNVFSATDLDRVLFVVDEGTGTGWRARRVWQQARDVGLAFETVPVALPKAMLARMTGRYYAVSATQH